MEEWRYYLFWNYFIMNLNMKTRQEIFEMRVATEAPMYKGKKVLSINYSEQEFMLHQWYNTKFADNTQILFWDSNFWEVMYDNEYFIDYLPATQVCNEIDAYAPLWYKACCAVSDDYLEFLDKVVKCTDN